MEGEGEAQEAPPVTENANPDAAPNENSDENPGVRVTGRSEPAPEENDTNEIAQRSSEEIDNDIMQESMKMEMSQEMMDDTLSDVFDNSEDEEEADSVVNQVLDEIGIDLGAMMGAAPVPVPPPIPAVIKTMSAPSRISLILSRSSIADFLPISGFAPAPKPLVISVPNCKTVQSSRFFNACASVLAQIKSTPPIFAFIMCLTALPPPPPTPITLIFALSGHASIN